MTIIRSVLLLFALVIWNASLASAQVQRVYCDASRYNALTNMWKVQPDENTSQVPASELPAERKIMRRVLEMFQSAFVPTGAAGLVGVNQDILPHAELNKSRYGNTYSLVLSNQKIECVNDKPAVMDVSYGNVSVQVNSHFIEEAGNGDSSVGFSFLPRGYYQLKDRIALPQGNAEGIQEFNFVDDTTVWWLTRRERLSRDGATVQEYRLDRIIGFDGIFVRELLRRSGFDDADDRHRRNHAMQPEDTSVNLAI